MSEEATLIALAERVEQASEASRPLDADVALTQGWHELPGDNWIGPLGQIAVPAYTASLDAAMTLVPEGCGFLLTATSHERWAQIVRESKLDDGTPLIGGMASSKAATPALALTAACLRARAASL